jgi:heme exporter protein D
MDQFTTLLHLGGYGAYVWPAYGVAAIVLIGLLWRTLASLRTNERQVTQLQNLPTADGRFAANASDAGPRHEAAR